MSTDTTTTRASGESAFVDNPRVAYEQLLLAARAGDTEAMEVWKERLRPGQAYLIDHWGETEKKLLRCWTGDNEADAEGIGDNIEILRAALEGERPSALERLLVARITCCWLEVQMATFDSTPEKVHLSVKLREYYDRRLDRSNRRFLAACKTLAQVRKLLGVNVQINIAETQMNVMGKP